MHDEHAGSFLSHTRSVTRRVLGFGVIPLAAILLTGCATGDSTATPTEETPPVARRSLETSGGPHGAWPGPLENSSLEAVSLEQGLASASEDIRLPDEAIVGIPTKVVNFPPDQKNRNKVGLAIAYDTGITLQIEPNRQPNTSLFHDVPGAVAMGRESYESEAAAPRAGKVNGRDAYLRPAGTQTLRSRKHQVPNMVGWMIGNTSYRLESSASSGVPLEDLVAAADSIR